jgi:hypothetical protein
MGTACHSGRVAPTGGDWHSGPMSDQAETPDASKADVPAAGDPSASDPKAAMKAALDRKHAQQVRGGGNATGSKINGGPHGQAAGRREFRRKSGG